MLQRVLVSGTPIQTEDHLFPINRHGYEEECYFTHISSPIHTEDGSVSGIFNGLIETTAHVLSERRSRALRRLSHALSADQDVESVARHGVHVLAAVAQDVPCVALYTRDQHRHTSFVLQAVEGARLSTAAAATFAPQSLSSDAQGRPLLPGWAKKALQPHTLPPGASLFQVHMQDGQCLLESAWGSPVTQVVLLPLSPLLHGESPLGYLLCGLSPRLRMDAAYSDFLSAAMATMGTALRNSLLRGRERQRAEIHRLVLETGHFGTWTFEPLLHEFDLSSQAAELFDCEDLTRHWSLNAAVERYHPEDRAIVRSAFGATLARGEKLEFEARLQRRTGEERWLWVRGSLYKGSSGHQHLAGLVSDISDRRRSEDTLRETEKLAAAGRLAATIAHEINNPLESVTNLIYLASLDQTLSANTANLLRAADGELSRVTHIAQQTLGFYRDTLGPVRIDIHMLVADMARLFERRFNAKQVSIDLSRVNHVSLTCLQGELRQVVSNLLANAIQASSAGSRVLVSTRMSTNHKSGEPVLRLLIADYGSGVASNDKGKLFTAFFTTKRDTGNGLGLWVSKSILEKQGGSIRFRSRTGKQGGTCFMVTLPIQQRKGGAR